MRKHNPTDRSPKQQHNSIGPKGIAHKLGLRPKILRQWLRRHGKSRNGRHLLWSPDEAQLIVIEYRNSKSPP
jgi:hypothetical protein